MNPFFVVMHLTTGSFPALATRQNADGSMSLTIFAPREILFRDGVMEYKSEAGDEEEDRVGYWTLEF